MPASSDPPSSCALGLTLQDLTLPRTPQDGPQDPLGRFFFLKKGLDRFAQL